MSFWPFTNSINNNSQLQKFLDSVQDPSLVTVDDLTVDRELSQELVSELHNIKGNYNKNANHLSFHSQFQQSLGLDDTSNDPSGSMGKIVSGTSSNAETASISSFNDSSNNGKDNRGAKIIEILTQPHILSGFIDILIRSVSFFHEMSLQEAAKLEQLIHEGDDQFETNTHDSNSIDQNHDLDISSTIDIFHDDTVNDETKRSSNISSKTFKIDEADEDGINEGDESTEEKLRRYIQISSDILSIDLWIISNRIIETPQIMGKLWSIIKMPELKECSPTVTYLVHILDQLMDTNSIELLNFIRSQSDLVDSFLNKIEIPMLMDFFLRVIQTDKPDNPTGIIETLHEQGLSRKLIEILKPDISQFQLNSTGISNPELFFKQTAATDFIKAVVTISSNSALAMNLETNIGPNELTRELASRSVIKTIIDEIIMYKPPSYSNQTSNKHGINNCVSIIIELIRKNNLDYDANCGVYDIQTTSPGADGICEVNSNSMFQWLSDFERNPPGSRDPVYLGDMLDVFSERMDDLVDLIDQTNTQDQNLGFTNFKIAELIAELLHCSNMILLNSKKVCKIIKMRDYFRTKTTSRLKKALKESIIEFPTENSENINDVTHGMDDVSLDNIGIESSHIDKKLLSRVSISSNKSIDELSDEELLLEVTSNLDDLDSEDEEPVISPEDPFVDIERDQNIRNNPCIGDQFKIKMVDSGILGDIIGKLTKYPWHNFFHNVVFDLIQQIFNGKLNSYNSFLIVELFKRCKCDLTGIIVQTFKKESQFEGNSRPGYMGHLILISEEIVKFTSLYKPDLISPIIVDVISTEDWEWFVNEILLKTREVYNAVLGAENDIDEDSHDKKSNGITGYGLDSSIGYLDLDSYDANNKNSNDSEAPKKKAIILGDKSNHDQFINENPADYGDFDGDDEDDEDCEDDEDDEDGKVDNEISQVENIHEEEEEEEYGEISNKMANVPISKTLETISPHVEVNDEVYDDHDNDYLDNLSGSSSSSDEDEEKDTD